MLYVYYKKEERWHKDMDLFLQTGVICVKDIYCTRKMQMHKHKITSQNIYIYIYKCITQKKFKLCFHILVGTSDNSPYFSSQAVLCVCSYKSLDMDLYLTSLYTTFIKIIMKNYSTSVIQKPWKAAQCNIHSRQLQPYNTEFPQFFSPWGCIFLLVLKLLKSVLNNMRTYKKFIQVAGWESENF